MVESLERFERRRGDTINPVCLSAKGMSSPVDVRYFVPFSDCVGVHVSQCSHVVQSLKACSRPRYKDLHFDGDPAGRHSCTSFYGIPSNLVIRWSRWYQTWTYSSQRIRKYGGSEVFVDSLLVWVV